MLNGRRARVRLDAVFTQTDVQCQQRQDEVVASTPGGRSFQTGEAVWVRDYRGTSKWVPGTITKVGPRNYTVDIGGNTWIRHVDQLRHRTASDGNAEAQTATESEPMTASRPTRSRTPSLRAIEAAASSSPSTFRRRGRTVVSQPA